MARSRALRRAALKQKNAKLKQDRRSEKERQKSLLKMSVVSSGISPDADNAVSMVNEVRHCHAALLYADEVILISPKAALLKAAAEVRSLSGLDFVRLVTTLGPQFAPQSAEGLTVIRALVDFPRQLLVNEKV